MTEKGKKVLAKYQRLCSRREYCSSELLKKIQKDLGDDSTGPGELLDSLKSDKYLDDFRYASAFAREKASLTGWGPVKIRFALGMKGIEKTIIDGALEEIDSERASGRLNKLLETKLKSLDGEPQAKLKLIKFALSRGYEYDEIREEINKFF